MKTLINKQPCIYDTNTTIEGTIHNEEYYDGCIEDIMKSKVISMAITYKNSVRYTTV